MNNQNKKKRKIVYLVTFFSLIIFSASLYFIKIELRTNKTNNEGFNIDWQQISDEFNQLTGVVKEQYQEIKATAAEMETESQLPNINNEDIEQLKEKIIENNNN